MLVGCADRCDCLAEKGEAPERPRQQKRLSNTERSRGPAWIDNVNMLAERWLRWKRWIDRARDKSFNGCVLHCGGGWFNPHQTQADDTCSQPQMLLCLCITWQFFICFLPCSYHEDEVLWKGSVFAQLTPMISASVPLLSMSLYWMKYCRPIHRFFF